MIFTQRIPAERLSGIDVREGDTLHIVAVLGSSFVVQVDRDTPAPAPAGKASEWLRTARGSVSLAENETESEARMAHYAAKYGL